MTKRQAVDDIGFLVEHAAAAAIDSDVIRADFFAAEIEHESADMKRYMDLCAAAARETKNIACLATKLRMTNQSRYTPATAARRAADPDATREKWQCIS